MAGGGGGGRNKRLEALQEEVLEQEIKDRQQLEEDLEARKRLRAAGGFRRQVGFQGPGRISGLAKAVPRPRTRAPARATTAAPAVSKSRGEQGGAGGATGSGGGVGGTSGGSESGGFGCFLATTQISTPNGPRPIEMIRLGDEVTSFRLTKPDAPWISWIGRVIALHSHLTDGFMSVLLQNSRALKVTPLHRILTPGGWCEAGSLKAGDVVQTVDGLDEVYSVEHIAADVTVYNLTITPHPHYVAETVLVHNVKHEGGFVEGPVVRGDVIEVIQQGEFVMSADAVELIGRARLEMMNSKSRRAKEAMLGGKPESRKARKAA